MLENRIAKAIIVASLALFALLVTFDNLTDYETNYAFVRHVLSMDTTFPGNALLYRRITSPALWQDGYGLITIGEGLTGADLNAGIKLALYEDRIGNSRRAVIGRRRGMHVELPRLTSSCIGRPRMSPMGPWLDYL